jgi:hypothetical protein
MKSQADLDIATFLASNPTEIKAGEYPKLMYNVNLPPMLVRDAATEAAIGSSWRAIDLLPEELPEGPMPGVPPVTIDPMDAAQPMTGGTGSFAVTVTGTGESGTWTAEKDAAADWLTIDSPTEPQTEDGTVDYTVASNGTGAERVAHIYVNGKTHTITQAGV